MEKLCIEMRKTLKKCQLRDARNIIQLIFQNWPRQSTGNLSCNERNVSYFMRNEQYCLKDFSRFVSSSVRYVFTENYLVCWRTFLLVTVLTIN